MRDLFGNIVITDVIVYCVAIKSLLNLRFNSYYRSLLIIFCFVSKPDIVGQGGNFTSILCTPLEKRNGAKNMTSVQDGYNRLQPVYHNILE